MRLELRDPIEARDWLAAGMMVVRLAAPVPDTIRQVTPWIRASAADSSAMPPPGILADFGALLSHPNVRTQPTPRGPLARILRSYEDQVVGRLAIDPHREAATDAVASLPPRLRPAAIALFTEQVLDRVGFAHCATLDPGALRDLDRLTGEEWVIRGTSALRSPSATHLSEAYTALVHCFQRTGRPIEPGDIAILEQLELLERRSARMALRQVVDASGALTLGLPKKRKPSRKRVGHISTQLEDDSAYPVGGFSSISTRGSIENLVTSELALMEDGDDIDLFDVRYTEGELLYYTRDETAFVRERRRITLVLSPSLEHQRFRDEGLPYQRLVLALALTRAIVDQLTAWLDRQDLAIRILIPESALSEEAPILRLALREWTEAGIVNWLTATPNSALFEQDALAAPTDVVWIGSPQALPDIPHVWQSAFETDAVIPVVRGPFGTVPHLPDAPWEAWRTGLSALLTDLV